MTEEQNTAKMASENVSETASKETTEAKAPKPRRRTSTRSAKASAAGDVGTASTVDAVDTQDAAGAASATRTRKASTRKKKTDVAEGAAGSALAGAEPAEAQALVEAALTETASAEAAPKTRAKASAKSKVKSTAKLAVTAEEPDKSAALKATRTSRTASKKSSVAKPASVDDSSSAEQSASSALNTDDQFFISPETPKASEASAVAETPETPKAPEESDAQKALEGVASEAPAAAETTDSSAAKAQNQGRNQNKKSAQNAAQSQAQNQNQSQNQNQGKNKNKSNKGFDRDHRRQRRPHGNREVLPSISRDEFAEMKVGDLREKAAEYGIDASGYRKAELVDVVFEALCKAEGIIEVTGILDIMNDGYGFLRTKGYLPSEGDAYVSLSIIRRNGLRKGDYMVGLTRPAQGNEKYAAIQKVISVNDVPADELGGRARFADLTPIYPDERLIMEHGQNTVTARVIDLVSPIGKGQRGLIVSPPKAGKTTILKDVAAAISANNPEVHLMCLLVDERPEEVTDMERSINGEVISSTFDKPCENHIAVAELVIERAKRLVEQGRDVVILLDSITRLARAYNMGTPASGRILSGGVDSSALYPPKRFLGAARNIENGGSLTILGTALVDTGSKMDEVIFEEFKGTGNMELKLDRSLADKRIFPAIDPVTSGTRKEELLLNPQEAPLIWAVRRVLANLNNTERAMDMLVKSIKRTETNQDFLIRFARKAQTSSKQDSLEL